ncbi:hypothetical protein V492_02501, partial [Pseudogymnoascus sp. VKM F-4246]
MGLQCRDGIYVHPGRRGDHQDMARQQRHHLRQSAHRNLLCRTPLRNSRRKRHHQAALGLHVQARRAAPALHEALPGPVPKTPLLRVPQGDRHTAQEAQQDRRRRSERLPDRDLQAHHGHARAAVRRRLHEHDEGGIRAHVPGGVERRSEEHDAARGGEGGDGVEGGDPDDIRARGGGG